MDTEKGDNIRLTPAALIQFGLLIPLMTIFAIASVYYYELGYFSFYKIPFDLIQIELTNKVYVIFIFLTLAFIIIFFLQPMIKDWTIATNKKIRWEYAIGAILAPFVAMSFVAIFLKAVYYFETLFLLFSFLIGLGLLLYRRNMRITNIIQDNFILKYVADYSSNLLGLLIVFSSSICMLMFSLGYINAKYFPSILNRNDNKTILLRNYSTYKIFKIRDTEETFIISKSINDNDTLHIFKAK